MCYVLLTLNDSSSHSGSPDGDICFLRKKPDSCMMPGIRPYALLPLEPRALREDCWKVLDWRRCPITNRSPCEIQEIWPKAWGEAPFFL